MEVKTLPFFHNCSVFKGQEGFMAPIHHLFIRVMIANNETNHLPIFFYFFFFILLSTMHFYHSLSSL